MRCHSHPHAHAESTRRSALGSHHRAHTALTPRCRWWCGRRFRAATLRALVAARDAKAAAIEESLAPLNERWFAALDGRPLFKLVSAATAAPPM